MYKMLNAHLFKSNNSTEMYKCLRIWKNYFRVGNPSKLTKVKLHGIFDVL